MTLRRIVGRVGLWLLGWRAVGEVPEDGRAVLIGHPHTSNWDFLIAILGTWALGADMKFIGKQSLFTGPFGWLFRALGGTPVDRSRASDTVSQIAERFAEGGPLLLGLAPSGTRKAGTHWRSGFYYIARAADVPVALGFLDFATRRVGLAGLIDLSGDVPADMDRIRAAYVDFSGRIPDRQIPIRLVEE
jgi:1-acyl-sn-glycerol-3-phosphate acyltransferase